MTLVSAWMHTEIFTVEQAAALWCGYDPSRLTSIDSMNPPDVLAVKQMLTGEIFPPYLGDVWSAKMPHPGGVQGMEPEHGP